MYNDLCWANTFFVSEEYDLSSRMGCPQVG